MCKLHVHLKEHLLQPHFFMIILRYTFLHVVLVLETEWLQSNIWHQLLQNIFKRRKHIKENANIQSNFS